jgi:hypothetical protein
MEVMTLDRVFGGSPVSILTAEAFIAFFNNNKHLKNLKDITIFYVLKAPEI